MKSGGWKSSSANRRKNKSTLNIIVNKEVVNMGRNIGGAIRENERTRRQHYFDRNEDYFIPR